MRCTSETPRTVSESYNFILKEKTLTVEKITCIFKLVQVPKKVFKRIETITERQLDSKTVETIHSFTLQEISADDLTNLRTRKIPTFVLKKDEKFFYTRIPRDLNFVSTNFLGPHQCAVKDDTCNRLSPVSDEKGGCEKVRNYSEGIELYPWITYGYETFNTRHDAFVVLNCLHYEKCPPRKKYSPAEVNRLRLGLAQYVYEDVTSLDQVRAKRCKMQYTV